jgi:mannitol/fructose-specific phosphotransferase system IIA component (Ntr-type)
VASIGLRVDFFTHFDASLVVAVLLIAYPCKMAGAALGARWGRMFIRDVLTVSIAMSSRGAMAVVLGLFALNTGIISVRMFVALVVMSMVTSMISGPAIRLILKQVEKRQLWDALSPKLFVRNLEAANRGEAIAALAQKACDASGLDPGEVGAAVWSREETLPTGIGNGVALPHARIFGIRAPLVAVGISDQGIDFDAPDDKPANVIFLILTPVEDAGAQLEIASEIARLFRSPKMLEQVLAVNKFLDFLALLKSEAVESGGTLKSEI